MVDRAMAKPVYVPTVVEATLPVDRRVVWDALLQGLGITATGHTRRRLVGGTEVTETAISVEPPWRLVLDVSGGASPFHQETVVLVPDPQGCLAMWSALVLEPTEAATEAFAQAVAAAVPGRLDAVVRRLG